MNSYNLFLVPYARKLNIYTFIESLNSAKTTENLKIYSKELLTKVLH